MSKSQKIKKRQGVIFQSGNPSTPTDEQFANQRMKQKSLDADTNRKQVGTSESLNPSKPSFGSEHW